MIHTPRACIVLSGIVLMLVAPRLSLAQKSGEPVNIGHVETIRSEILQEDRDVIVYRHPEYDQSRLSYPVLYVLDADDHFLMAANAVRFLGVNTLIPKMLVVAIRNTDRWRDLTPPGDKSLKGDFPTSGGSDNFLRFLKDELIPHIDQTYRTEPYRILSGHSLGGLMTGYAFLNEPELFQAYITIDPSYWWNSRAIPELAAGFFSADKHRNLKTRIYITINKDAPEAWPLAGAWLTI